MSNDSFRKIVDTVVDTSSVANPLKALNVSNSFQATANVTLTTTNVDLTPSLVLPPVDKVITLDVSGMTAARSLTVGTDTASNAKNLRNLLRLRNSGDQVVLRFLNQGANISAFNCSLANTSGTSNNVIVLLNSAAPGSTQVLTNTAIAVVG